MILFLILIINIMILWHWKHSQYNHSTIVWTVNMVWLFSPFRLTRLQIVQIWMNYVSWTILFVVVMFIFNMFPLLQGAPLQFNVFWTFKKWNLSDSTLKCYAHILINSKSFPVDLIHLLSEFIYAHRHFQCE